MPSHHVYLHVPFCRLVCAYCDFVTVGGRAAEIPRYVDALVAEVAMRPHPGELATIYFGGGTPSLLQPDAVARLIEAAFAALRPGGRMVVNVGTLEGLGAAYEALKRCGPVQALLINIARGTDQLETLRFEALNPNFLLTATKTARNMP